MCGPALLCSAVSRIAKRYHWWHAQSSPNTRARTLAFDLLIWIIFNHAPSLLRPKKARLGLSSVDLRWTVDYLPLVLDGHPNLSSPCQFSFTHLATGSPFYSLNRTQLTRQPPSRCSYSLNLLVVCGGYTRSKSPHQLRPAIHYSCGASFSLAHSDSRRYLSWKEHLATADRACLKSRRLSTASPAIHLRRHATARPTSTGEPLSKATFTSTQYRLPALI